MKPKKAPPDIPERGDRCCLRGDRYATGTLRTYDPERNWARVDWDTLVVAPQFVHRFELMRVAPEAPNVVQAVQDRQAGD